MDKKYILYDVTIPLSEIQLMLAAIDHSVVVRNGQVKNVHK